MKRRAAMKVSKIAHGKLAKAVVWRGNKVKTTGGLKKSNLKKNRSGKIVSVRQSAQGKKAFKHISKWHGAVQKARKALGVKGFCPVGGKSAKGAALLKKARSFYK